MRILWIVQRDLIKDLNVSTWIEMTKSLLKRNHEVTLIALSTSKQKYGHSLPGLTLKELKVINRFPLVAITFHLQVLIRSFFWILDSRPDVVMTHPITAIFLLPVMLMTRVLKLNIKFILDVRTLPIRFKNLNDTIKNSLVSFSIWLSKHFFHGVTVITPSLQRILCERFHLDPGKTGIWMSGVNADVFSPQNESIMRTGQKMTVMYHGALAENRGLLETIEAMFDIKSKISGVQLIILGKGFGYEKLVERVEQLDLKEFVQFHDPVAYEKIPDHIARADIGIIPLPDELCWQVSSPLKLFEYLSMAKPVILSPIEAHTSVLNGCPAAIFLKSTSPEDISEGIKSAYARRDSFHQMGMKGREFVLDHFTWDSQARNLETFIQKL
ncbi:MAG: glycosyltransferase family 4 protein [bacterium]|nr:glycosyltransferase family 4 protein [bacterium]